MLKITKVEQTNEKLMEELLGKKVECWCGNYIWVGDCVAINDLGVKLENVSIVYETGRLDAEKYQNEQKFNKGPRIIFYHAMESCGLAR